MPFVPAILHDPWSQHVKKFQPAAHQDRPTSRWMCSCGVGHHQHEINCVSCRKPYTAFPEEVKAVAV